MAYLVVVMSARLSVHSDGRESERRVEDHSESDAHDVARRSVARRQLEFRDLGRISRLASGAVSNVWPPLECDHPDGPSGPDVRPRSRWLGPFQGDHSRRGDITLPSYGRS